MSPAPRAGRSLAFAVLIAAAPADPSAVKACLSGLNADPTLYTTQAAANDLRAASADDLRKAEAILAAVELAAKPQLG